MNRYNVNPMSMQDNNMQFERRRDRENKSEFIVV